MKTFLRFDLPNMTCRLPIVRYFNMASIMLLSEMMTLWPQTMLGEIAFQIQSLEIRSIT